MNSRDKRAALAIVGLALIGIGVLIKQYNLAFIGQIFINGYLITEVSK